jgi:hypothetical protein
MNWLIHPIVTWQARRHLARQADWLDRIQVRRTLACIGEGPHPKVGATVRR